MKTLKDFAKQCQYKNLPLGSTFSCKFKDFKPTKSGNGIMLILSMVEQTTGEAYTGSIFLAEKAAAESEEFDRDSVMIVETLSEKNADGYTVIKIVD